MHLKNNVCKNNNKTAADTDPQWQKIGSQRVHVTIVVLCNDFVECHQVEGSQIYRRRACLTQAV